MSYEPSLGHGQGKQFNRPPILNEQYYSWVRTRMQEFIQAEDFELCVRITNGPLTPNVTNSEGKKVL